MANRDVRIMLAAAPDLLEELSEERIRGSPVEFLLHASVQES
jgi:hypothetical protein